jgi:hypothetical protein
MELVTANSFDISGLVPGMQMYFLTTFPSDGELNPKP